MLEFGGKQGCEFRSDVLLEVIGLDVDVEVKELDVRVFLKDGGNQLFEGFYRYFFQFFPLDQALLSGLRYHQV